MKKVLLGSTAIVAAGMIAAVPSADAASKMKLSVGGYMEQWVGFTSQDDGVAQDYSGFSTVSDGEIHFKGKTKLDNGITVGVNVQLEAQQGGDQIDEQYMTVSGGFGQIIIGDENSAMYKMHYAPSDFGIGTNSGDVTSWNKPVSDAEGDSIAMGGHYRAPFGATYIEPNAVNDSAKISYFTPRVSGFQLGLSYAPDGSQDNNGLPNRDTANTDYIMVGANFVQKMGGMSVGISGGYGTVTDAAAGGVEPEATSFGIKMGMGGVSAGVSYANYSDHGNADAEGINAGIAYSSGPMGVSVNYYHGEKDGNNGDAATLDGQAERDVIHLSAKYAMGPGVTLAGTLGHAVYSSDDADIDNSVDESASTYVVMGLKVGF
ncbi:MAG: porin [Thalassobaculaceae bacterium]